MRAASRSVGGTNTTPFLRPAWAATLRVILKRFTDNHEEVAEELATHYKERSATSSYPPSFQLAKSIAEREFTDFLPHTGDVYNTDITLDELLWALYKGQGASTGDDSIGYPLLQRLTLAMKMTLFELLNKIWRSDEFPASCRNAVNHSTRDKWTAEQAPACFLCGTWKERLGSTEYQGH